MQCNRILTLLWSAEERMKGIEEELRSWITWLMMKQSMTAFEACFWHLEGHLWVPLRTLKIITEKKFLKAIWGSENKTHHQTKAKKRQKIRAFKMAQNLMLVLLTLQNTFFYCLDFSKIRNRDIYFYHIAVRSDFTAHLDAKGTARRWIALSGAKGTWQDRVGAGGATALQPDKTISCFLDAVDLETSRSEI